MGCSLLILALKISLRVNNAYPTASIIFRLISSINPDAGANWSSFSDFSYAAIQLDFSCNVFLEDYKKTYKVNSLSSSSSYG